jgi:DNA invertase Pin-like site-specific DNA recombinase
MSRCKPVRQPVLGSAGNQCAGCGRWFAWGNYTAEQADSGLGLKAQREAIELESIRRGWGLVAVHDDAGRSGKSIKRPGLEAALSDVDQGRADALVVAKLDRLSRSLADFAALMERSRRKGWSLVALDLGVDTSTPSGEFLVNVLASAAQWGDVSSASGRETPWR